MSDHSITQLRVTAIEAALKILQQNNKDNFGFADVVYFADKMMDYYKNGKN